jgi:hypothetical protein
MGPMLGSSGIALLIAKNITGLRSVSGIYTFFTNKVDLLVFGLSLVDAEVGLICVLL